MGLCGEFNERGPRYPASLFSSREPASVSFVRLSSHPSGTTQSSVTLLSSATVTESVRALVPTLQLLHRLPAGQYASRYKDELKAHGPGKGPSFSSMALWTKVGSAAKRSPRPLFECKGRSLCALDGQGAEHPLHGIYVLNNSMVPESYHGSMCFSWGAK